MNKGLPPWTLTFKSAFGCFLLGVFLLLGCDNSEVDPALKDAGPHGGDALDTLQRDGGTPDRSGGDKDFSGLRDANKPPDNGLRDQGEKTADAKPGYIVPGSWKTIPAGAFSMGSPTSEYCRDTDEDLHQVTLTQPFLLMQTEVTQGQFKLVMGYNPATEVACGNGCPVETLNWHEAVAYCNSLSLKSGLTACYSCSGSKSAVRCQETPGAAGKKIYSCPGYRLPTEAEWEYAYRAGTASAFYSGPITDCTSDPNADKIGWYSHNASASPHPVAQKPANTWGLYDMAGNVYEWCHDWYQPHLGTAAVVDPFGATSGTYRSCRGGGWGVYNAEFLRGACRYCILPPTSGRYSVGFRCAKSLLP
jgi:formylglycine-generating enzyme required for sulfatase activity